MAIRQLVRAAVIGAAALGCAATFVPAASASGAPQVVVTCESGASRFFCDGTVTGGTAPYIVTWTAVSNAIITRAGATAQGTCRAPFAFDVRLTVRDAAGVTASGDGFQGCNGGAPV